MLVVSVVAAGLIAGTGTLAGAAPRLKVAVSVPSVLAGNASHLWLANTGASSVLELRTSNGTELRNVSGAKYQLDDSDAIAVSETAVWVANASSNTVTEIRAADGKLLRVVSAPKVRLEVPVAIVVASHHVFVLSQKGTRIVELSESTGRLVRVLAGPRYHFIHTAGMVAVRGDVWTANGGGKGTLTEFNAMTGRVVRVVTAAKARLSTPVAITSDGAHLWVANRTGKHLSELEATTGALVRTFRVQHTNLDRATSMAVADHVVWVARAGAVPMVVGVNSKTGRTVQCATHKFGFPAVFSDGRHIWVVDRTESRLSEVVAASGAVLRVVVD